MNQSAASHKAGGHDYNTKIRLVITFPPRIINLLALSTDQKTQLQAITSRIQND
jgi:hypothetical protein